uniref:Uncharacterized protein n=1 Tax=Anguilla anguilla TaxID=7936 RepID=A0A0E9WYA7_ANGAN
MFLDKVEPGCFFFFWKGVLGTGNGGDEPCRNDCFRCSSSCHSVCMRYAYSRARTVFIIFKCFKSFFKETSLCINMQINCSDLRT